MSLDDLITGILIREGSEYTDHPADRGGPTKYGITLMAWEDYLKSPVHETDVMAITEADAREFYKTEYFFKPKFDRICGEYVQELLTDCGVNHGTKRAVKWLQKACRVLEDGDIGPKTIAAYVKLPQEVVMLRVLAYRTQLFGRLVSDDPKLAEARMHGFNLQAEFAEGWNNRTASFLLSLSDVLAE